jgi:orotidine-5'-phosphate decarboxylase
MPEVPDTIRRRLALALDVDDLVLAQRLARGLQPWFGIVKVGLELYAAAGPDAVASMRDLGFEVFCDLKMHDIPNTVGRAARVLGALGVQYVTLHTTGGVPMLRAGVDGLHEGAADAGLPPPVALGVTVLTSESDVTPRLLRSRVAAAVESDCGGVVCATSDIRDVRQLAPKLTIVVPGIRVDGGDVHDQARVGTPAQAIEAGADVLVVGRAVTASDDPAAAAAALAAQLS